MKRQGKHNCLIMLLAALPAVAAPAAPAAAMPANADDGLLRNIIAVATGASHTCALTAAGGVKCWGNNDLGQVGDGTAGEARLTPVDVSGLSSGVQAVTVGAAHSCVLTVASGVKCWGFNDYGQIGDGTAGEARLTPVNVSGLTIGVQAVIAGWRHTCALTTGGGVQASAVGGYHTCALTTGGSVLCWGQNWNGQLAINPGWTPVDVIVQAPAAFLPLVGTAGED